MKESVKKILFILPFMKMYYGYRQTRLPKCSYFRFIINNIKARRGGIYWSIEDGCKCISPHKIYVGKNSDIGRMYSYIQGMGGIYIGDYVQFGPNIGLMTSNHDLYVQYKHHEKPIIIGDYCWLGRGVNITSGVVLGTRTIVGTGSVVTKSFPEGYCIIAGNPAKIVKHLDKEKFTPYRYSEEYYGYLTNDQFQKYKKKYLKQCPFINEDGKILINLKSNE